MKHGNPSICLLFFSSSPYFFSCSFYFQSPFFPFCIKRIDIKKEVSFSFNVERERKYYKVVNITEKVKQFPFGDHLIMNLHQQPQEQPMNIDLNNQSLTSIDCNYYQNPFNEMKGLDSGSQATTANQGQPMFEQQDQQQHLVMPESNKVNSSNSSSATSTPLPQSYTTNNSDIMSVCTVLSQQTAEMNQMTLSNPTTSVTPQNLENNNMINTTQANLPINNSPNHLIHSNVISNVSVYIYTETQLSLIFVAYC